MKRYSDEFKEQAIGLAREASRVGKGIEPVARELGVHPNTLRAWVQRDDLAHAGDGKNTAGLEPKAQIEQLQKEIRLLKMEREILKKAAAFFAKENS
jgi:transposase